MKSYQFGRKQPYPNRSPFITIPAERLSRMARAESVSETLAYDRTPKLVRDVELPPDSPTNNTEANCEAGTLANPWALEASWVGDYMMDGRHVKTVEVKRIYL